MDHLHFLLRFILPALLASLNGCAIHAQDANGNERVIGFVNAEIAACDDSLVAAGRRLDIQMLGIGIIRNESGTSFNLGYTRERSAAIRDHALVLGDWKLRSRQTGEIQ